MLTDEKYVIISPTPFDYPTHPGTLILPDGTTTHTNSNMRISHTKKVRLFREVTEVEQAIVQKIVATF